MSVDSPEETLTIKSMKLTQLLQCTKMINSAILNFQNDNYIYLTEIYSTKQYNLACDEFYYYAFYLQGNIPEIHYFSTIFIVF